MAVWVRLLGLARSSAVGSVLVGRCVGIFFKGGKQQVPRSSATLARADHQENRLALGPASLPLIHSLVALRWAKRPRRTMTDTLE